MSKLVRLYPRAWRDRYEEEFLALIAERPPTAGDLLDTVRGAIDAHLHPQSGGAPQPWTHRLPGLFAATAGAAWAGLYLYVALWADPSFGWGSLLGLFLVGTMLSLPGDYMAAHGRQIASALGTLAASLVLAKIAGWNVVGLGLVVIAYAIAICGPLTLAAIRAGIGARGRWLLLGGAVAMPIAVTLAISVLQALTDVVVIAEGSTQPFGAMVPYGLAWLFVGVRMTVRGAPTIIDPPLIPNEPEVSAA